MPSRLVLGRFHVFALVEDYEFCEGRLFLESLKSTLKRFLALMGHSEARLRLLQACLDPRHPILHVDELRRGKPYPPTNDARIHVPSQHEPQ